MTIFQEEKYIHEDNINGLIGVNSDIINQDNNNNESDNDNNSDSDSDNESDIILTTNEPININEPINNNSLLNYYNEIPVPIRNNINFYKSNISNKKIIFYLNTYIKIFIYFKYVILLYHTYLLLTNNYNNLDLLLFKSLYFLINLKNIDFYYSNTINIKPYLNYKFPIPEFQLFLNNFLLYILIEIMVLMILYNDDSILYYSLLFILGNKVFISVYNNIIY